MHMTHRCGCSSVRNTFQIQRYYALLSMKFPEGYDVMCTLCHDSKLDFVRSVSPYQLWTYNNNTQFHYKLLFARFTPESTLTHTMPIPALALSNILQQKALIRTPWFSPQLAKYENWFLLPQWWLCWCLTSCEPAVMRLSNGQKKYLHTRGNICQTPHKIGTNLHFKVSRLVQAHNVSFTLFNFIFQSKIISN